MAITEPTDDATLDLPRILCLHGGGVTAAIFRAQFRSFLRSPLATTFRFIFVDAPFYCDPGPGILPVYATYGPYRRWLRWLPSHAEIDSNACVAEIEYSIDRAMAADKGTGPWVGLLGFSQGAKLAASLLFETQLRLDGEEGENVAKGVQGGEDKGQGVMGVQWRFAILLAGRAPLVSLSPLSRGLKGMQDAGGLADNVDLDSIKGTDGTRLRLPTVHVHGMADEGLWLHRRLLEDYCEEGSAEVVDWEGAHRIPIKKADVERVVEAALGVGVRTGCCY